VSRTACNPAREPTRATEREQSQPTLPLAADLSRLLAAFAPQRDARHSRNPVNEQPRR
jgi:hypothetical protein